MFTTMRYDVIRSCELLRFFTYFCRMYSKSLKFQTSVLKIV